jgi:hypothetical protein|tara:strand:- start:638 stop:964 length:327 start_codon:yes stop_codon:yes gene_type:complete
MSNSKKDLLNGITNTTYLKFSIPNGKKKKMFNFTTTIPELDKENEELFIASDILEKISNSAGLSRDEFYRELVLHGVNFKDQEGVMHAAIAIETMLALDLEDGYSTEH